MKDNSNLIKLSRLFESLSDDKSLNKALIEEGINPQELVNNGIKRIERIKNMNSSEYQNSSIIEMALEKWKTLSAKFNKDISREIEPLLLNSNKNGLKLFFQSIEEIQNQENLKKDLEQMQLEITLFKLRESLKNNQKSN